MKGADSGIVTGFSIASGSWNCSKPLLFLVRLLRKCVSGDIRRHFKVLISFRLVSGLAPWYDTFINHLDNITELLYFSSRNVGKNVRSHIGNLFLSHCTKNEVTKKRYPRRIRNLSGTGNVVKSAAHFVLMA